LRSRCLSEKTSTRTIQRWEHEDVLDRHRDRMKDAAGQMRRRAALAEHPFGTLKCRAGYRHFLVRGFNKVRGEWSLMALCYNFSRALEIIGLDRLIAYFAQRAGKSSILAAQARKSSILQLLGAIAAVIGASTALVERIWDEIGPKSASGRRLLGCAA
jgi:hypothetical protein